MWLKGENHGKNQSPDDARALLLHYVGYTILDKIVPSDIIIGKANSWEYPDY